MTDERARLRLSEAQVEDLLTYCVERYGPNSHEAQCCRDWQDMRARLERTMTRRTPTRRDDAAMSESEERETRTQRKIRLALAELGYTITDMYYEPIGPSFEMSGRSGGWWLTVEDAHGNPVEFIGGFNADEVIQRAREQADTH